MTWERVKLGDCSYYVSEKINLKEIKINDYISTENMLPNKCGIIDCDTMPQIENPVNYKKGDILVSNIRPYFKKIYFAKKSGGCSNDVLVFRLKSKEYNSKFLYYVLSQDLFFDFMMKSSNGTKMPRGNKKIIPQFVIPLPPIETQEKIADILSKYDDLIENNQKQIKLLEEAAQRLYKKWFVDFQFPGHETTPIINSLPQGWKKDILGNYVEVRRGASPRPIQNYLSENGLNWLKISDATISNCYYILDIKEHIIETGKNKSVYLKKGDLVLSNSATPGIPKILDTDCCIHDGWLYFTKSYFSNEFLLLFFINERENIKSLGTGAVFTNLKIDIVKNFTVNIPPKNILENFQKIIFPIFLLIKNKANQMKQLTEARDRLLPKLMNEEIKV